MFKVIPQYPSYEISAYGTIRRVETKKILKPRFYNRYLHTSLSVNNKYYYHTVHRLVAMAWLETPENYKSLQVAHNDGDPMNNHYTNLRWATAKENIHDKYAHNSFNPPFGENHHASTLNVDIVVKMRREIKETKANCSELSKKYGKAKLTIYDAVVGNTWKSVNPIEPPVNLAGTQYAKKREPVTVNGC